MARKGIEQNNEILRLKTNIFKSSYVTGPKLAEMIVFMKRAVDILTLALKNATILNSFSGL